MTKSELRSMICEVLTEELSRNKLNEARSAADIQAEINRLQKELEQAKVAEKKAALGNSVPKFVYGWDMYLDPSEKGEWTSENNDSVFETEEKAFDAGLCLLRELAADGELGEYGDYVEPEDYTIDIIKIPLARVSAETLEFNELEHLIP